MSSKNTTKAIATKAGTSKNSKNAVAKSQVKTETMDRLPAKEELLAGQVESKNISESTEIKTGTKKAEAAIDKSNHKVSGIKVAGNKAKEVTVKNKKITIAASTYHYYRNWLSEFMRAHGVPSARFKKEPESYDGHITVIEAEKVKGIRVLEDWKKQNPDIKDLFWDLKK